MKNKLKVFWTIILSIIVAWIFIAGFFVLIFAIIKMILFFEGLREDERIIMQWCESFHGTPIEETPDACKYYIP